MVYSFGVGQDISWDLAMIERFGVTVHAFDPAKNTTVDTGVAAVEPLGAEGAVILFYADEAGEGLDLTKAKHAIDLSVEKYCSVMSSLNPDIAITNEIHVA